MADVQLPHFAAPFQFSGGSAVVNEQDSVDDVRSAVFCLVSCPQGSRSDQPDFGVPDTLFATVPVNTAALNAAITRVEPRATLDTSQTFTGPSTVEIVEAVGVADA